MSAWPHAEYMYKNGLSLEEYIDALALYPFKSARLTVSDEATGALYEIYSVAVDAGRHGNSRSGFSRRKRSLYAFGR